MKIYFVTNAQTELPQILQTVTKWLFIQIVSPTVQYS